MTVVAAERETCTRHPGGCRDADRHPLPVRVRTDTKREMAARVKTRSADTVNAFAEEAVEARLGRVHCNSCHRAVAVEFGDLTGKPLDQWIREAVKIVRRQECDAHEPVSVGAVPAPGTAVFMEPGGQRRLAAPVPPPPDHTRKKGRRP